MVFQNFRLIFKPRIAPNPALLAQPLIIFRGHITTRTKILAATTTPSEIKGGVGGRVRGSSGMVIALMFK